MPSDYSPRGTKLLQRQIPDEVLVSIGRLIRAWAEIERILDLYLVDLTSLNEAQILVFIGRQSISAKLALAGRLAKLKSSAAYNRHHRLFVEKSELKDIIEIALKCRNVVCHGQYVGVAKDEKYAFNTPDISEMKAIRFSTDVHCYDAENLEQISRFSEEMIAVIADELKLKKLIKSRSPTTLARHSKAPKRRRNK